MRIGDHTTLYDLFAVPGAVSRDCGPLAIDEEFVEAVQRSHEDRYPTNPSSQSREVRALKVALVRFSLESAVDKITDPDRVAAIVHDVARALRALRVPGNRVLQLVHATSRAMSDEISWLLAPAKRTSFRTAFLERLDRFAMEIAERLDA